MADLSLHTSRSVNRDTRYAYQDTNNLAADWAARGWSIDDLAAFRMEGPDLDAVIDNALAGAAGDDDDGTPAVKPAAAAAAGDDDDLSKFGEHSAYIKQLRSENAGYRTERNAARDQLGRFTSAFDGLDDELQATFLDLPQAYRNDPVATAKWMKEQGEAILAGQSAGGDDTRPEDKPLTRAEYDKLRAEEKINGDATRILAQVTELGYDPATYKGRAFLAFALETHSGDIDAAHKAVQAEEAAAAGKSVEEYVAAKRADAKNTPTPVTGGANKPTEKAPEFTDIKGASKAAASALDAIFARNA